MPQSRAEDLSLGAIKRPRLEVDTEEAGPSCSPPYAAPPPAGAEFAIGKAEDYEDVCYLGDGAYGAVFKARHRATGRIVAIKRFIPPEEGTEDDEEEEERDLFHEAAFLEACAGVPFVVRFHELVRDPATAEVSLVMEYAGQNMADFVYHFRRSSGGARPPESTLRAVMWQLLTAAAGIHARGVIHRDIKMENILVSDDLRAVKLCDFGLAMRADERPPHQPTGTPGYRAPEMLLELPEYDGRVDAWSLGCVMARILTGRLLFEAPDWPPDEELLSILRVLGVPDEEAWPGFLDTPFAVSWMPELDLEQPSTLRELIPETKLSDRGFEVLSGLLVCNPDKRLTAAAALKLPWFTDQDALEMLPIKAEPASALTKNEMLRLSMVSAML